MSTTAAEFFKYLVCKLQVERYDTVVNLVVISDIFWKSRFILFLLFVHYNAK